jgi:hypothetical protein
MGKNQTKQKVIEPEVATIVDSGERFSGHESFACRYGWLPKLYELVSTDPSAFDDDEAVMVKLGIGRNMVRSIRFWGDAFGLTESSAGRDVTTTAFAKWLFDSKRGEDPYLEAVASYWLLHWRLTVTANLAAWNVAFLETPEREILRRFLVHKVERRAELRGKAISTDTAKQHVDVFLNCYATARVQREAPPDDVLSCPLQELGLITLSPTADRDDLVELNRAPWPHLDEKTFLRIVLDFWDWNAPTDTTMSVRTLLVQSRSPGLALRLDETSMIEMLRRTSEQFPKVISLSESVERRAVQLRARSPKHAKEMVGYV